MWITWSQRTVHHLCTPWTIATPSIRGSNPLWSNRPLSLRATIYRREAVPCTKPAGRRCLLGTNRASSRCTASSDANASRSVYVQRIHAHVTPRWLLLLLTPFFEDRFDGYELGFRVFAPRSVIHDPFRFFFNPSFFLCLSLFFLFIYFVELLFLFFFFLRCVIRYLSGVERVELFIFFFTLDFILLNLF